MISKQMYKVLKKIPHAPSTTTMNDLHNLHIVDINILKNLLNNAIDNKYITFSTRGNPYNDISQNKISLTEAGQVAIEEFKGTKYNTKLSTWAIIIAGLSFIVSIIALFVS